MKIVHIQNTKQVKRTKRELEKELSKCKNEMSKFLVSEYKSVPTNKPTYVVEMSMEELQLISFYLELENRKPIMNVELKVELKKENNNE